MGLDLAEQTSINHCWSDVCGWYQPLHSITDITLRPMCMSCRTQQEYGSIGWFGTLESKILDFSWVQAFLYIHSAMIEIFYWIPIPNFGRTRLTAWKYLQFYSHQSLKLVIEMRRRHDNIAYPLPSTSARWSITPKRSHITTFDPIIPLVPIQNSPDNELDSHGK